MEKTSTNRKMFYVKLEIIFSDLIKNYPVWSETLDALTTADDSQREIGSKAKVKSIQKLAHAHLFPCLSRFYHG